MTEKEDYDSETPFIPIEQKKWQKNERTSASFQKAVHKYTIQAQDR